MTIKDYSSTAASNTVINGVSIVGGAKVSNMDDGLRQLMADISNWTDSDTLVSGATTDLGSVAGMYVTVSGTATITSFGTLKAGMVKFVRFSSTPSITYNSTSMILPRATSITVAAGDTAVFVSQGSGSWRCLAYLRYNVTDARSDLGMGAAADTSGTAALPAYAFDQDTDTGMYRVGANELGFSTSGTQRFKLSATGGTWSVPSLSASGTAGAPGYAFSSDATTGMYLVGAGSLGFSTSGSIAFSVNSVAATFSVEVRTGTFSTTGASAGTNISTGITNSSLATTTTQNVYRFYNPNGQVGSIQTSGGSTIYNTTSDGQLKVNRVSLSAEMDVGAIIDAVEPCAYDWLNPFSLEKTGERGKGFVAQDLHKHVPEAVSVGHGNPGDKDYEPWAVDQTKLVAYLWAEIKSLRKRLAKAGI